MPNVVIVDFDTPYQVRKEVETVFEAIGVSNEAVTTVSNAETRLCSEKKRAPYLIVRDSNPDRAKAIAEALSQKGFDVEWEVLAGFMEGKQPTST